MILLKIAINATYLSQAAISWQLETFLFAIVPTPVNCNIEILLNMTIQLKQKLLQHNQEHFAVNRLDHISETECLESKLNPTVPPNYSNDNLCPLLSSREFWAWAVTVMTANPALLRMVGLLLSELDSCSQKMINHIIWSRSQLFKYTSR